MPPVTRARERNVRPGSRGAASARAAGSAAAASAKTAGVAAGKLLSEGAARAGVWVHRYGAAKVAAGVAAVVVLALILWWLTSLSGSPKPSAAGSSPAPAGTSSSSSAPANRGPLPLAAVVPLDFQLGDCFKDFDPEAPTSTVVDCATGHSAQLIAVDHYAESDSYPGLTALKDKGRETCRNARLAAAATNYALMQRNAYPSSTSWDNGDRRVDCYVTADTGNVIMESLLP